MSNTLITSNVHRVLCNTMALLTFHLHDLIGVLYNLILGLVAEGVGPGLDQI